MKTFGGIIFVAMASLGLLAGGTGCIPTFLDDLLPNIKNNPVSRVYTPTNTNTIPTDSTSGTEAEKLTDTFIVMFKGANNFAPKTAAELLAEFNKNHPQGVTTHHFRTKVDGQELIGMICADTVTGKNKIANMINSNTNLVLVGIKQATNKDLEQHYALGLSGL
jgi:hypothetical protein